MGGSLTLDYKTPPRLLTQYPKVFLARRPRLVPDGESAGRIEGRVVTCRAARRNLGAYRQACGFQADGHLPVTYPHVLATSLHLGMLTSKAFPVRLPGLIHKQNRIIQWRPIPEGDSFSLFAWLEGYRATRLGQEFELTTDVLLGGERVWQESATLLARGPNRKPSDMRSATPAAPKSAAPTDAILFRTRANTGRRYARVSGDFNPIHLFGWSARLFGLPTPIAHGMWSLARCCAELITETQGVKATFSCDFKRPVPLPAKLRLERARIPAGLSFMLCSEDGNRLHLAGVIEPKVKPGFDSP
ncbi:MAG: MaoC/PaaZ C-terminal domain-containing protein [Gammaproteobacteria bacterium]